MGWTQTQTSGWVFKEEGLDKYYLMKKQSRYFFLFCVWFFVCVKTLQLQKFLPVQKQLGHNFCYIFHFLCEGFNAQCNNLQCILWLQLKCEVSLGKFIQYHLYNKISLPRRHGTDLKRRPKMSTSHIRGLPQRGGRTTLPIFFYPNQVLAGHPYMSTFVDHIRLINCTFIIIKYHNNISHGWTPKKISKGEVKRSFAKSAISLWKIICQTFNKALGSLRSLRTWNIIQCLDNTSTICLKGTFVGRKTGKYFSRPNPSVLKTSSKYMSLCDTHTLY